MNLDNLPYTHIALHFAIFAFFAAKIQLPFARSVRAPTAFLLLRQQNIVTQTVGRFR